MCRYPTRVCVCVRVCEADSLIVAVFPEGLLDACLQNAELNYVDDGGVVFVSTFPGWDCGGKDALFDESH